MITPTDFSSTYGNAVKRRTSFGSPLNEKKSGSSGNSWPIATWVGFFTVSLAVYSLLSGGDFSFLLTYGAMARMFAFALLNAKIFGSQSVSGVSIKTLQLYSLVFFFRLSSIIRHEGYLPYDKSGDWLYHLVEFMALTLTASALFSATLPFLYKSTYQATEDSFGEYKVPSGFGAVYLAVPIAVVAMIIHPALNADFFSDTAWTMALYLESAALIPQLYMFQKSKSGRVELLNAHVVAALGLGRCLEFFFWIHSHHELTSSAGSALPGYFALAAQLLQLVLMADFFWCYFRAVKNSASTMELPSHEPAGLTMV